MTELALFLMLAGFLLISCKLWWDQRDFSDRIADLEDEVWPEPSLEELMK